MRVIVAVVSTVVMFLVGLVSVSTLAEDTDPSTSAGEDANAMLDSLTEVTFGLGSELVIVLVAGFIIAVLGILVAAASVGR